MSSALRRAIHAALAAADGATRAMLDEHAEHRGMTMSHPHVAYAPLDRLVATVRPLRLAGPVLIAPPTGVDTVEDLERVRRLLEA